MKRLRGLVPIPPWFSYWLFGLAIAWLFFGWVGGAGFWLAVVVLAGVWGFLVGRKYTRVTLEPWSKERGIVIWSYRRRQRPDVKPRLVWDDTQAEPSSVAPSAPEVTPHPELEPELETEPSSPAVNEGTIRPRRLPFPPPSDSPAAPPLEEGGHKTCPDCAETVLAAARVCRYCGYRFEQAPDSETSVA